MRFSFRQLEYFVAAGETGSVTRAAQGSHSAQPTVSAAIAKLERALGVQLFVRHHAQGLSLTPEGRRFLGEAKELLRHASEVERLAVTLSDEIAGVLDLGCLVTLAPLVAPSLVRGFEAANPRVHVELVESHQDGLLERLRAGLTSAALTYDLQLPADVEFEPLVELPPHALLPAGHRLALRKRVGLGELAHEPHILLDLPLSRDYFLQLFAEAGLEPVIALRSEHPETIRTLVANGFGYGIVNARPRNDRALDGEPVVTVPLRETHRPMRLGLASLRGIRETRTITAFKQHCRETITPDGVPGMLGAGA
ncbi:MAG TPA: LysR family transcriptional regulator [Gaiellales bacterium]|jgi:DNA-binding transcriptional LysR family regulator|nr:LysR family transcriptional regulator [Gaiellales bacterium]